MSNPSSESLGQAMSAGVDARPGDRLRGLVGTARVDAHAVPLNQDAYEIAVDHIEPDPAQPRKVFDPEELDNLAASIRENGLLQPIVVYRNEDPSRYRIIAGERRYRAAILAGRSTVPCLEMPPDFDRGLVDQLQLVENIQRADLHPVEAAEAISAFIERHALSQREAARRLGKPLAFVAELLAIRKIPPHLLSLDGASRLPKQVLVEVGRASEREQEPLIRRALSGSKLEQIREQRSNRESRRRVVYFRERFVIDGHPPIEIRWRKHPDQVSDDELVDALAQVAQVIAMRRGRGAFEVRTAA
jgi:ParB family chromosome partitioning protein